MLIMISQELSAIAVFVVLCEALLNNVKKLRTFGRLLLVLQAQKTQEHKHRIINIFVIHFSTVIIQFLDSCHVY